MSLTVNPATNYLTTSGFAYDANGNMTSMPATGGNIALSYDVENRTGGAWFDQQNQPLSRAGAWNLYGLHGERLEPDTFGSALIVINGQLYGAGFGADERPPAEHRDRSSVADALHPGISYFDQRIIGIWPPLQAHAKTLSKTGSQLSVHILTASSKPQ